MRAGAEGFTLIELMVTIAVAAVVLSIVVPSFGSMIDRSRLRNAAEQLRSDLAVARSEALRRGRPVVVSFTRSGDGATWCYGMTLNNSCDCTATTGTTACFLDGDASAPVLRTVSSAQYRGISLAATPFASGNLSFNNVRQTVAAGGASFVGANSLTLRVVASGQGRMRLCTPSGAEGLTAYEACT